MLNSQRILFVAATQTWAHTHSDTQNEQDVCVFTSESIIGEDIDGNYTAPGPITSKWRILVIENHQIPLGSEGLYYQNIS